MFPAKAGTGQLDLFQVGKLGNRFGYNQYNKWTSVNFDSQTADDFYT